MHHGLPKRLEKRTSPRLIMHLFHSAESAFVRNALKYSRKSTIPSGIGKKSFQNPSYRYSCTRCESLNSLDSTHFVIGPYLIGWIVQQVRNIMYFCPGDGVFPRFQVFRYSVIEDSESRTGRCFCRRMRIAPSCSFQSKNLDSNQKYLSWFFP